MPRYKLMIEYDGTPFVGWQVQDNGLSVQGVLTEAIATFCGERSSCRRRPHRCRRPRARPGRACRPCEGLGADVMRDAVNAHLRPQPIAVLDGRARWPMISTRAFRRRGRHYLYRIFNRRAPSRSIGAAPGMSSAA